jgi:hypothetical protein
MKTPLRALIPFALLAASCAAPATVASSPTAVPPIASATAAPTASVAVPTAPPSLAPAPTTPIATADDWAGACGRVTEFIGNTTTANGSFVLTSPGREPLKVTLTAAHSTPGGAFGGYVCVGLEAGVPYPIFGGLGVPNTPGFINEGTYPATNAKPTPTGFVLPQACAFVATPVVGTDQTEWSIYCGAANNNNARGILGPALVQQGWALCASGLATAQWRKDNVMLGVVESSLAPGEYMRIHQFARVISPCT